MQVSWLPTALATITAATEESTPPDRPQSTRLSPICSRMAATEVSTKESIRQSPAQPQISNRKFFSICAPFTVCSTSGWNWTAYSPFAASSIPAQGQWGVEALTAKPAGRVLI